MAGVTSTKAAIVARWLAEQRVIEKEKEFSIFVEGVFYL